MPLKVPPGFGPEITESLHALTTEVHQPSQMGSLMFFARNRRSASGSTFGEQGSWCPVRSSNALLQTTCGVTRTDPKITPGSNPNKRRSQPRHTFSVGAYDFLLCAFAQSRSTSHDHTRPTCLGGRSRLPFARTGDDCLSGLTMATSWDAVLLHCAISSTRFPSEIPLKSDDCQACSFIGLNSDPPRDGNGI